MKSVQEKYAVCSDAGSCHPGCGPGIRRAQVQLQAGPRHHRRHPDRRRRQKVRRTGQAAHQRPGRDQGLPGRPVRRRARHYRRCPARHHRDVLHHHRRHRRFRPGVPGARPAVPLPHLRSRPTPTWMASRARNCWHCSTAKESMALSSWRTAGETSPPARKRSSCPATSKGRRSGSWKARCTWV